MEATLATFREAPPGVRADAACSAQAEHWFCLRTHPKREQAAAAQLRSDAGIDVFLPLIRFKRSTRFGPAWTTEALFPNYVFALFDLATSLRRVRHARAVRGVVHFGHRFPAIPDSVIEQLRAEAGAGNLRVIGETFHQGEEVRIAGGLFHGLDGVVTRTTPTQQRVAVLLQFLGRQTAVELDTENVVPLRGAISSWT